MRIVGADIGGTSIKLGLFDEVGNAIQMMEYETNSARGGRYVMEQLMEKIAQFKQIDAIGVCTAGQVNRHTGVLKNAVNIPESNNLPIKAMLEERFLVPVIVENDVNAAALGENHFGVGKNLEDFLFIAYGTGIGGAIIHDRTVLYGKGGFAGEFGHMVTHAGGLLCNCKRTGCYEMYGSTRALIREAKKIAPIYTNGKAIFNAYNEGDQHIQELVSNWVDDIVIGLVSLVHIFNPPSIVVGGGVMEQDMLATMIEERVNAQMIPAFRHVHILQATLGNQAGMLGAISSHV